MSLLSKFTKKSNLDPLKRLADVATRSLENRFENAVEDLFSSALRKSGLSSNISQQLSSRFGDALKNELADKYFQTASSEYNRVSRQEICDNFLPSYADTSSSSVRKIDDKLKNLDGTNVDVLQFPGNLAKYYMTMQFRQYVRQAPQLQSTLKFDNAIILPIPRKLEDGFSLNISDSSLGTPGAIADVIQTVAAGAKEGYSSTNAVLFSFMTNTLGELSNDTKDAVTSYLGSTPNPHVAAIFQGVNLREHQFEWTFAPRNPEESVKLKNIILKLKQNSLPAFSTIGTPVFQYPLMCQIQMEPWHRIGADLITYKPALLKDVKVNYSPNGIPSFFAGTNLPTFINISLSFIETTYFTSGDFDRAGYDDNQLEKIIDKAGDLIPDGIRKYVGEVVGGADDLIKG